MAAIATGAAAALSVVPVRTLYEIEDDLATLIQSMETVTPEQEEGFIADFGRALEHAKDKRDGVARYMAHCESQIELAQTEIDRLRERKASFEAALSRLKDYVIRTMESLGTRKLEGSCCTLSLRKCPASVEVRDESGVPAIYKSATLTMPGELAARVLDALAVDDPVTAAWHVDKRAVKAALDAGADVAGAGYAAERFALVRR